MRPSHSEVQDGLLVVRRFDEDVRVRIALDGELDLSNAPTVEAALAEAIESEKKVVIDLGRLAFLDSTGVALIVRTLSRTDAERFSFLPSRSGGVRRLLEMTGLDQRMVLSSTDDQETLPTV
jgi:anti-anti-sigma factor